MAALRSGASMCVLALLLLPTTTAKPAAAPRTDELVVRVYSFGGITWGHVNVYYDHNGTLIFFRNCSRRRCYFYPLHGRELFLRETPRPSKHWVFRGWIVRNGGKTVNIHHPTMRLKVIGHNFEGRIWYRARVKANYIYP